jgi:hypothetical protein
MKLNKKKKDEGFTTERISHLVREYVGKNSLEFCYKTGRTVHESFDNALRRILGIEEGK